MGGKISAGGSDAEAFTHVSSIRNGLSLVQGHFSYILVQIVTHSSVNQMLPVCLMYLSKLCVIRDLFIVFRMLSLRKLF